MNKPVERTCTELRLDGEEGAGAESKPLSAYRSTHAYVLLGDAGSGKTTAFAECKELGDEALFITARDFLVRESALDELRGRTLFIDGLDEVRAGALDKRSPFDRIRGLLIKLGRPRFRISCREADWLGENDRQRLAQVAKDSVVVALRLNPLTGPDIKNILRGRLGVSDPEDFIRQAHERGVGGLLDNPQSLELLAKAISQGVGWPKSRLETFDLASREMARECNQEHLIASRPQIQVGSLIQAAGRLCSLLLIADRTGYSLDEDSAAADYPSLYEGAQGDATELRAALSSKLFKADSERCFSPVHRQIAEFLGAKYVAALIENGLPSRRALALITGGDGTVVTALRGLSAWLASHSQRVRTALVSDDAAGLAIYGDIQFLGPDEKQILLAELLRQPRVLARSFANIKAFAPLAAAETETQIRQVLKSADRDPDQETRTEFILLLLGLDQKLPGLAEELIGVVRDDSWSSNVRLLSLDAFIRNRQDSPERTSELEVLLADFNAMGISDSNRDLCGTLLHVLYPRVVRPREVWDYLTERVGTNFSGTYWQFWRRKLLAESSDDDIAELLDTLASRTSELEPGFEQLGLRKLPVELLERGLRLHEGDLDKARIHGWLGAGAITLDRLRGSPPNELQWIRAWLERRPEVQMYVVLAGLKSCPDDDRLEYVDYMNRKRLFGAKLPTDFGLWCLNQAVEFAEHEPRVAKHLFLEAYRVSKGAEFGEGLSEDVLREYARQNDRLEGLLAGLLAPPPPSQKEPEWRQRQSRYIEEQERQQREWLDWIRSNERALLENRAQPALLHQLALVYFGELRDFEEGCRGEEALVRVLGQSGTVSAAMHGLRHVVDRDDLPSIKEILRLAKNQREHYLGLPLLAALEQRESSSPGFLEGMNDSRVRSFVACYHYWARDLSGSKGGRPAWCQSLLDSSPELVSEVAVQCGAAALRSGRLVSMRFWEIADNEAHGAVARAATLGLLRVFPTRCTIRQLETLDHLLWAAIRRGAQTELLALARQKLSRASTNVGQRVRWLGTGLICSPGAYRKSIAEYLGGKEKRIRHAAQFYVRGADTLWTDYGSWRYPYEDLDSTITEIIVRILGGCFVPCEPRGPGFISDEIRVSRLLVGLVNSLGSNPGKSATGALESLLGDVAMTHWHGHLSQALDSQRIVRRDAEYRHPTLQQVCKTLQCGPPANPGDLAALTVDVLRNIAVEMRRSNRDKWGPFWNEVRHGKLGKPKVENSCRNALLHILDPALPSSVNAQPEVQHANQARADIVVSANGFQVPIEVKRNSDRRLWRAVHDQLIPKYTVDPAADGYGIYVVLWFGADKQQQRSDGVRPESPERLEKVLRESLGEDKARKISVCVIDVCPTATD